MRYTLLAILLLMLLSVCIAQEDTENNTETTDDETKNLKFKLLFFREDCFNEFLKFNIFYKDCISITISKGLGYGIILGASAVKLPQVFNILKAQSGAGILVSMFYMEAYMHIINGCYNIHLGSPFSVYGENFCLLAQNLLLIALIWYYERNTTPLKMCLVSLSILGPLTYLFLDFMVPIGLWKLLMNIQIIMVAYSRMPQIVENFRNKTTGELSSIMFILNTLGNLARLFTFVKETSDVLNMCTSGLSAVLNFTIFVQVLYYWKNTQKYKHLQPKEVQSQRPSLVRKNSSDEDTQDGEIKA